MKIIKIFQNRVKIRNKILLLGVLFLAFFLRFYRLGEIPSFHTDEADFANNAYSILKTGRDQTGKFLPLGTTSTGDLRPAFYVYLSLLPIKIWGFTEFAARFPTLIFSTLSVLMIYLFAKDFFKNEKIALLSGFFMAVSFWHIALSREASEKVVALFFVLLGVFLILRYFREVRLSLLIIGFTSFLISIHTYYLPRLFLIMFIPSIWILFRKKLPRKENFIFIGFMAAFVFLTIFFTFFYGQSRERINQLIIFKHPYTMALLGEQIREEGFQGNVYITRFFHNKPMNYTFTFLKNYLEYYSPRFLFLEGGEPPRVKIPAVGLLNIVELPFFLIGFYFLLREIHSKKKKEYLILVFWFLLSPVPAAFTFDEIPNVYRSLMMLPSLNLFTAFGLFKTYTWFLKNKIALYISFSLFFMYFWNLFFFLHQYFVHFEVHQPWYRNYAQKQLALLLKEKASDYEKVFITKRHGGTDQVIRFYLKYDPVKYQREGSPRDKDYQGFGNLVFVPENCPYPQVIQRKSVTPSDSYLFINNGDCEKESQNKEISVIKWKDGLPAYRIVGTPKLLE